jgi:thiol-disulfide isomerase/thioredoxin
VKRLLVNSLILCFLFLHSFPGNSQGIKFTSKEWQDAVKQAAKEDKLVFLDMYTDWCGPCKLLKENVFIRWDVANFFNKNFINVQMNLEKGLGPMLGMQYGVRMVPTLIFITPDGTLLHKIEGFQKPQQLINHGEIAMLPERKYEAWDNRYVEGVRMPDFLYSYAKYRETLFDGSHVKIAEEYLGTQKDWLTDKNIQFIYHFSNELHSTFFKFMTENKSEFIDLLGKQAVENTVNILVQNEINRVGTPDNFEEVEGIIAIAYPENPVYHLYKYRMDYYKKMNDEENFILYATEFYDKFPPDDKTLRDHIDLVMNSGNKELIRRILPWQLSMTEKSNSFEDLISVVGIYYDLGMKKEALYTAKMAKKLGKNNKENKTRAKEMIKKVKSLA